MLKGGKDLRRFSGDARVSRVEWSGVESQRRNEEGREGGRAYLDDLCSLDDYAVEEGDERLDGFD